MKPDQRIVEGARHHFFVHGFRGVTMDDLAAELGMSKKTLYANFPSKSELIEAVILKKFSDVESDLGRLSAAKQGDFTTRLQVLLECITQHLAEFRPPFIRDMQRVEPELFKRVESRRREAFQRHFGALFEDGRRCGLIRKDIPPGVMMEVLLSAVQAIMNPHKIAELGLAPQAAFAAIITLILEGAATNKGRKL